MIHLEPHEVAAYYRTRLPKLSLRGSQWRTACPVHNGKRDSFAVDPETGRAHCHSECARGWDIPGLEQELSNCDFKTALGHIEAVIGRALSSNGLQNQRQIAATYDYQGEDGALLFQVLRYEPKDFRQRRPDGKGGWIWNVKGIHLVPYRLPSVLKADEVYVVEGEKDVESLRKLGLAATCNAGGAGKWRAEYSEYLRGKTVYIIPDADEPGRSHARTVAASLKGVAASVRIVNLPSGSKDATEWVQKGGDALKLKELAATGGNCTKLLDVVRVFQKWLHLPDPSVLYVNLGTVAANKMPGDPIWLMNVGPPGSGKTEVLNSLRGLPNVHMAATLTEPALLSGTPKKDTSRTAKGGLLREIGEFGIPLAKDFTSILSMHRASRAAVLAALREVYDGSWTRHLGTDGGKTLTWSGKVAVLAGVTPTIDSHHAVMASTGERFVLYRLPDASTDEQAQQALTHVGKETQMRRELQQAVTDMFTTLELPTELPDISAEEQARLVGISMLAVRLRSAVERDSHNREIELIPEPEAPGRLALTLRRLLGGMVVIGVEHENCWKVLTKVAFGSAPSLRWKAFKVLADDGGELTTTAVATRVQYPTKTTRRALEDLTAHGLVIRRASGPGNADAWGLSEWAEVTHTSVA